VIVIGERLNSSRRAVLEALRLRDEAYLLREAKAQREAGGDYIDFNAAALLGMEIETLTWAVPLLEREAGVALAIDTPNADAMRAGLRLHQGRAVLNSLTAKTEHLRQLLPIVREHKPRVIALCMDDQGVPASSEQALVIARRLVEVLDREGVAAQDVFLDPLVRPVGVDQDSARLFLESLQAIKEDMPGVQTVAGISNVSFGLPMRRLLNRTLLLLALQKGLDAAILDPLDKETMAALAAGRVLLGSDPGYKSFLALARANRQRK
jgi:cobalamin-dependent methionine synthase I